MSRFLSVFLLLATCLPALGQTGNAVKQSGNVTPGHAASWTTNGIIQDAGTAANGFLTSLGVVGQGQTICQSTAPPTAPGYQQVCWNISDATGVSLVIQNFGTDTPQPFSIVLNGTTYNFPYTVGGIVGPVSSTVGDVALFNNTSGSLLSDSGVLGSDLVLLDGNNTLTGNNTFSGTNVVSPDLFSILGPNSTLLPSANTPNELLIESGSSAHPIIAGNTPTVQISRTESIVNGTSSGDGSLGSVMRIDATTNNTQQLNGLKVFVTTNTSGTGSTNDNVAFYAASVQSGDVNQGHIGYDMFGVTEATTVGNGAVFLSGDIQNLTGAPALFNPVGTPNLFVGLDLAYYGGTGHNNGGVGVEIRSADFVAYWDVGLAFYAASINTADIQSNSSATNMWLAPSGTHSYGLQWGSATFTTAAIFTPGFVVSPTGVVTGQAFIVGAHTGLSCTGSPTSSFASVNGIVTHC
jgi:hypothetical protein